MEMTVRTTSAAKKTDDRALLKAERLAWPTVLWAAGALALWVGTIVGALSATLPLWAGAILSTIAAFASFTPMHDASHRSIARVRRVNEVLGRLASVPLMAPFVAFRYLHLEHHKHTNHPEKDPDFWSGRGPWWQLPLRWLTQDLYYYVVYLRTGSRRARRERWEAWGTLALFVGAAIALSAAGFGLEVLLLWVIPSRLATAALAFGLDFLPHHPHTVTSREDRYRATSIIDRAWLTPLLMYQNYHLVHHLYPGVPFYRYARVWRTREETLRARGVRVR